MHPGVFIPGVSEIRGTSLRALLSGDPTLWGSILGSPIFVNRLQSLKLNAKVPQFLGLGYYRILAKSEGSRFQEP